MRKGTAHKVPLIVGTNADEGRLFTRFLKLLPTTEHAIERILAHTPPEVRERILAAYPQYPHPKAHVEFGGDMIFSTAAWQIAEAHAKLAPHLRVPVRLRAPNAALGGFRGDARHRTAGRVRGLPIPGRCGADGGGGPAHRGQGQPSGADPLA